MGLASSVGIISGIDYGTLVAQLVDLESRPILLLQSQKASLETVSAELSTLSVKLSNLQSASTSLASLANFNANVVSVTSSTSGVALVSASVDSTAITGTTEVQVNQIAQTHSIASAGFVDDDTTAVASAAGTFTFQVGTAGATYDISVTTDTTLVQLRDAINEEDGSVQAFILNDGSGSNPYRLVLTANDPGAANTISISSNPTTLDFTNKQIEDAYANETNSYAGTVSSNSGNNYTGTTNKTYLIEIVTAGTPESGTAQYKYSIDGGITFLGSDGNTYVSGTNDITVPTSSTTVGANTEGVQISFGSGTGTLVVGDEFTIDVFNPELQEAKNAVIVVGNLTLSKSTNTITDVIQGVTLTLIKADSGETIEVTVSTESSGVETQIEGFISAYNDVIGYLHEQLSFDPDIDTDGKPLLGDTTAVLLNRQIQNIITAVVPGASSGLNSLATLGVETDTETSEISLDSSTFEAALATSIEDVTRLFIGIGVPNNSQIEFVSKTDDTNAGTYGILINTVPVRATILGANDVPSSGITADETISVNFFIDATDSSTTPTTAQVTVSAGSTINDIVNALNSEFASQGMDVSASNNDGKIQIRAASYGDDHRVQVLSTTDPADIANQSGFSSDLVDSVNGTTNEIAGVDIGGTINGFNAIGEGAVLTSGSGFGDDGLSIRAEVSSTGNYGTVKISSGVADQMLVLLARYVDLTNGTIKIRQDGIQDSVDSIDESIERKTFLVAAFEQRTLQQFQRLEVLLGQFQTQGNVLAAGLASIASIQTQINNR